MFPFAQVHQIFADSTNIHMYGIITSYFEINCTLYLTELTFMAQIAAIGDIQIYVPGQRST